MVERRRAVAVTLGGPPAAGRWTEADAQRWLLGLEQFGMRFGLERMHRLLGVLGEPQRAYDAIHVVGTNGKSSTVRMIAAILQRHGRRTGAYLSPHLVSFAERVRIDEHDLAGDELGEAAARAARAAAEVDRGRPSDDRVTQFEALTAIALSEMARRAVDVAVVEAGLGGRLDATNVLGAPVVVLTNVGLEHTRWLGPTVRDIAREKLAVVRPGAKLVVGAGLHPDALEQARALGAELIEAPADAAVELAARGGFQRRNFAVARSAAEAYLGALDAGAVAAAAAATGVPGRFEQLAADPPTFVDGAHNPDGMAAMAETLREELGGRPLTLVLSVLDDKDAERMLGHVAGLARRVVATTNANPRALGPAALEEVARRAGAGEVLTAPDPRAAMALAREAARADGGIVLATGSIYLVADLLRGGGTGSTL